MLHEMDVGRIRGVLSRCLGSSCNTWCWRRWGRSASRTACFSRLQHSLASSCLNPRDLPQKSESARPAAVRLICVALIIHLWTGS